MQVLAALCPLVNAWLAGLCVGCRLIVASLDEDGVEITVALLFHARRQTLGLIQGEGHHHR